MVATSTSSYLHDNGSSTFAATTALSRPEDAAYFITVSVGSDFCTFFYNMLCLNIHANVLFCL
jgi:hypothetical protein